MIRIVQKCKTCKGDIKDVILSDVGENSFTQFRILYCPNCIELDEEVPAYIWAKTIHKTIHEKKKK